MLIHPCRKMAFLGCLVAWSIPVYSHQIQAANKDKRHIRVIFLDLAGAFGSVAFNLLLLGSGLLALLCVSGLFSALPLEGAGSWVPAVTAHLLLNSSSVADLGRMPVGSRHWWWYLSYSD